MSLSLITFEQVCMLFILILIGFISVKSGVFQVEGKKVFSNLLVSVVMPCMILNTYFAEFNPDTLSNLLLSFGLSTVALVLAIVLSFLFLAKSKSKNKTILKFACSFSNAGYMGFPLIQALYGAEGLLYASAFITMFNIIVWTFGYVMVSGAVNPKAAIKKIASTPVLYAVVVGLVIYLCRIPVPNVIKQPVALIGNMNTPVSMMIIGMVIAGSNVKKIVTNKEIWYTVAVRMVMIPLITYGLFYLLGVGGMVTSVVLVQAACPSAAVTSVLAIQFGHDEDTAAGAVVMTTLCSIVALPLFAMLLPLLG